MSIGYLEDMLNPKGDNVCTVDDKAVNCKSFTGDDNPFANSKKDEARITISTRPIGEPGINHKPTMTCYPIDTDGKIIKKGYLTMEKTQVPLKNKPNEEYVQTLQIVVGILGGLLVLVLAVVLGPKIKHAIAIKLGLGKTAKAAAAARVGGPLKK